MIIVVVHIHVKKGEEDKFLAASMENAENSLNEPGFLRFDILRQDNNPQKFIFYEVYRDSSVPVKHKETAHYLKWRGIVDSIMEENRYGVQYSNCFPDDMTWR